MNTNMIGEWEQYFYKPSELMKSEHSSGITPKNDKTSRDGRHYNKLFEQCFGTHVIVNPMKISLDKLRSSEKDADGFFNDNDISNLFINNYYETPPIRRFLGYELGEAMEEIQGEDILRRFREKLAGPDGVVVLIGEVGEGKSAFLSRLALDLKNTSSTQYYYPVIFDVQAFYDAVEKTGDESEINRKFWKHACEIIAGSLGQEFDLIVPNLEIKVQSRGENTSVSLGGKLSAYFLKLKGEFKDLSSKMAASKLVRNIDVFEQLKNAACELKNKYNVRLVLIFDNLDTFYYDHERFLLFEKGLGKFKLKINVIKKLYSDVRNNLANSEMSYIFTARPYVYPHVFQSAVHDVSNFKVNAVFSLAEINPETPINTRLKMLDDLAGHIKEKKSILKGKGSAVSLLIDSFISNIPKTKKDSSYVLKKFHGLSNQGYRSIIKFYNKLPSNSIYYRRFFSHNVLFLYMLGMKKLYSQVDPEGTINKEKGYFPNVFLIRCEAHCNAEYPQACQPHRLTYWLKYLILYIIYKKGRIKINELLNILDRYEDHAVRLCIGSLGTVNEYNCLSFEFPEKLTDLRQLENQTHIKLSKRGEFLISDDYCLRFECLQLYYDDWLLPRPKKEYLGLKDSVLDNLIEGDSECLSYDYLLNGDEDEYRKRRASIIHKKARQSLLLLSILKIAMKYEMKEYAESWSKVESLLNNGKEIISEEHFKGIKDRLIRHASKAISLSPRTQKGLEIELSEFQKMLAKNEEDIERFFSLLG